MKIKIRKWLKDSQVLVILIIVALTIKSSLIEIYVVPQGSSKGIQHAIEKDVELAAKGVLERTGIVMGVGDFIVVNSGNATTSFNAWGMDLS